MNKTDLLKSRLSWADWPKVTTILHYSRLRPNISLLDGLGVSLSCQSQNVFVNEYDSCGVACSNVLFSPTLKSFSIVSKKHSQLPYVLPLFVRYFHGTRDRKFSATELKYLLFCRDAGRVFKKDLVFL